MIFEKFNSVTAAKNAAKKNYGYECVFTGLISYLDGAHVFNAGPYPELKYYSTNIFPMIRIWHKEFDFNSMNNRQNTFDNKIKMLAKKAHPCHRFNVRLQLEALTELAFSLGVLR